MRRTAVALSPLIGLMILGACSGDNAASSKSIVPTQPSLAVTLPAGCDYTVMKSDARAYFSSSRDAVFGYIGDMQNAAKTSQDAATEIGWKILNLVASERLTSAQSGTPAQGATFVVDVLTCANVSGIGAFTAADPNNASQSVGALALAQGVFAVRGGSATTSTWLTDQPARAWVSTTAGRVLSDPIWGVQKGASGWGSSHFLLFGYPKAISGVTNVAFYINTNVTGQATTYNGFELNSVPGTAAALNDYIVGVCEPVLSTSDAHLLLHSGAIVFNVNPSALCSVPSPVPTTLYAMLKERVRSAFAPAVAFAQFDESIGGLPSSWSPFTTGTYTPSNVTLTLSPDPLADGTTSTVYQLKVSAADENGAIPGGVQVTLTISGNNGTPGLFQAYTYDPTLDTCGAPVIGSPASSLVGNTNVHGNVTFCFSLTKTGGFNLTASGLLGGVAATQSATTQTFNVKGQ